MNRELLMYHANIHLVKHTEISIINDGNGMAEAIPELSEAMTEVRAMSCQQTIADE